MVPSEVSLQQVADSVMTGGIGGLSPAPQQQPNGGKDLDVRRRSKLTDVVEIVFVSEPPDHLICKMCSQALRHPLQLTCAHRFCQNCLNTYRVNECPSCGKPVDVNQTKVDKKTQRAVQELAVYCTWKDNGCGWQGVLRDLQGHATQCDLRDVVCVWGCGQIYKFKEEQKHIQEECGKRTVNCQHCGKSLSQKGLPIHLKVCPSFPMDCPNKCGLTNVTRMDVNQHLASCPMAGRACPFSEFGCIYADGKTQLQQHLRDQPVKHLSLLCDALIQLNLMMSHMQLNMEKMMRNMIQLQGKSAALEKMYGAQMVWRIDDVRQKMNEARSGARTQILSPPFISARHGYKMQAHLALNGDGQARGRFVSAYVSMMRGDYDALLGWPFTHRITFTLMDQKPVASERRSISSHVVPSATRENVAFLERPSTGAANPPFGAQKFVALDVFERYIVDDTIFLKIEVDVENMPVV